MPSGTMIMAIAEKFGQMPEAVENMDAYWFERAALVITGESAYTEMQTKKRGK